MIKTTILASFAILILVTGTLAVPLGMYQTADGATAKGTPTKQVGSKKVCGDRLCSESAPAQKSVQQSPQDVAPAAKMKEAEKAAKTEKETYKSELPKEKSPAEPTSTMESAHSIKVVSGTITSATDPGVGHETHQLAVILPPSDKVYKGTLTYSASEPVQLVALHGPLGPGEDKGQAIWTPDGKTKFGLTFIDNNAAAGSWHFTGNALAVHTVNEKPFTVSYTVNYVESPMSDTIRTGTLTSATDPGVGHETHQLAIVLPPRDKPYYGTISFTASEKVQLVALHGPLKAGQDLGQPIWTPDGKTKFALTFVDKGEKAGVWQFAGNALAFHTLKETPFTITYTVEGE